MVDLTGVAPPDLSAEPDLAPPPGDPTLQHNRLLRFDRLPDVAGWQGHGVALSGTGSHLAAALSRRTVTAAECQSTDIAGGLARLDPAAGLCAGRDPLPPGSYAGGINYYNGGAFYYGTLVSTPLEAGLPPGITFDHLIASFEADTPPGTWIELRVRARKPTGWTKPYSLGIWAADFGTIRRHSVIGQKDGDGDVQTDTLALSSGANGYELTVTLFSSAFDTSPTLRALTVVVSHDMDKYPETVPDRSVHGMELPVPGRSQGLPEYRGKGYGGGGEVWCSPTSTSMVMAYWANITGIPTQRQTVPDAAAGTYDHTYDGTGNWPFNTAYAARFALRSLVTRLRSLADAEAWIKGGMPLVLSIAFKPGELPGAPISQTSGHLIVLRGFTSAGDPIVNDPAGPADDKVRYVYPRAALEAAWSRSHRTAYAIFPDGRVVPAPALRPR